MKLLFLDTVCPKPYDPDTLRLSPLGGTEGTVIRIAEGLAELGLDVTVGQHNRAELIKFGARYESTNTVSDKEYTHIVVLRNSSFMPFVKARWPKAKLYLWCHDLATMPLARDMQTLSSMNVKVIPVSEWHKNNILNTFQQVSKEFNSFKIDIEAVHNPIDDDLGPGAWVDNNKLVYFSSPHKGLENTLKMFAALHYRNPKLELFIANPGYLKDVATEQKGVVNVGSLPHSRALDHVKGAFCVLYPNTVFPETFGLVFAEANAVGTPVLTHDLGAASEVLTHPKEQLTDCRQVKNVVDLFEAWYTKGRPKVEANPKFRLKEILQKWTDILKRSQS